MARPRFRSPDQPLPVRWLLGLYETCASLQVAVLLIVALVALLVAATVIESWYGAAAARFGIYGAGWFTALGGLLGLNVLCAALVRFPWKKYQTGFLLTHAGLLILLAGCLWTRTSGVDAQLPIFEGHTAWRAFEDADHFHLAVAPRKAQSATTPVEIDVPFAAGPFNWDDYARLSWFPWRLAHRDPGVVYDRDGIRLDVLDYHSDSRPATAPQIALHVTPKATVGSAAPLAGERGKTLQMAVRSGENPHGPQLRFGMGARDGLAAGQQFTFWLAGTRAATDAFRQSRPEGDLGPLGQLILHAAGKRYRFAVDTLEKGTTYPLGSSGIEMQFGEFDTRFLGVRLEIHAKDRPPQPMVVFAGVPEFNRQDYADEVFADYWFDPAAYRGKEPLKFGPDSPINAAMPRVDIIQGDDLQLYYRVWHAPRVEAIGPLPADGSPIDAFAGSGAALSLRVEKFLPRATPGIVRLAEEFDKSKGAAMKERQARVRLTVDGRSEEFWLVGRPADPLESPPTEDQQHVVAGPERRVTITMPRDEIDVGFQVYLRQFQRRLDPGTTQASHYGSLVDILDRREGDKKTLQQNVLITLNAPLDVPDPQSGRSYRLFQESFRGPWRPGDPLFDQLAGSTGNREQLFLSWLTVNYDPGRAMKYAGSVLIAMGIAIVFWMKAYFFRRA